MYLNEINKCRVLARQLSCVFCVCVCVYVCLCVCLCVLFCFVVVVLVLVFSRSNANDQFDSLCPIYQDSINIIINVNFSEKKLLFVKVSKVF